MGEAISADYCALRPVLVCVLKGAVFFMADLSRRLAFDLEMEFMAVSSYGRSTDSSGVVRILKDLDIDIEGRHVLIVEDIIDSGFTLQYLTNNLGSRNPAQSGSGHSAQQTQQAQSRVGMSVYRLRDTRRVRGRLRARLRRGSTGICPSSGSSTISADAHAAQAWTTAAAGQGSPDGKAGIW